MRIAVIAPFHQFGGTERDDQQVRPDKSLDHMDVPVILDLAKSRLVLVRVLQIFRPSSSPGVRWLGGRRFCFSSTLQGRSWLAGQAEEPGNLVKEFFRATPSRSDISVIVSPD